MASICTVRPARARVDHALATFVDENTGRTVRQLTDLPKGAHLGYFRNFKQLPDGCILAHGKHDTGNCLIIDAATGELEMVPHTFHPLKVRERDGRVWFVKTKATETKNRLDRRHDRELWTIDLPGGEPRLLSKLPDEVPGVITDITIDGSTLILLETEQDVSKYPIPTTRDLTSILHFFSRPRRGAIWTYNFNTGETRRIYQTQDICPLHLDTSPSDPTLLRYCHDMSEVYGQRVWTVRTDGSDVRMIRKQARGEMITHEFWWADPNYIGYTYQDRRLEDTVHDLPWAEYAKSPTQLGLADLAGNEVYLSDPLNSYHSHLYMSPDGRFVCGEGTEGHSFAYAAAFSMSDSRLKMVPLATIHTTYVPFRGQGVDCNFSADGRWLIYADKRNGAQHHQLYAVEVDL